MTYRVARFNCKQTAIRTVNERVDEALAAESEPAAAPIRYAKDLPKAAAAADAQSALQAQPQAAAAQAQASSVSASAAPQQTAYQTTQSADSKASKNDLELASVLWLASLIFLMIPGMLVLLSSNSSPYLREQAREAINWTVTFVVGSLLCTVLLLVWIGGPLQVLLSMAHVVFCLLGAQAAYKGNAFSVPMSWRPFKG